MREVPTVVSNNNDIVAASVDFRRGFFSRGDWYVTWCSSRRPWETAIMRLPLSDMSGTAALAGRRFEYRVHWRLEDDDPAPLVEPGAAEPLPGTT